MHLLRGLSGQRSIILALCAGATPLITLTIETGPTSAALTGVSSVAAAAGIANFSLTPNLAGLWRLRADATGLGFDISPNLTVTQAAASIAFIVQPGTSAAGSPISPSPQIEIRDGLGQRLTSATMAITLSLAINPTATSLAAVKPVETVLASTRLPGSEMSTTANCGVFEEAT